MKTEMSVTRSVAREAVRLVALGLPAALLVSMIAAYALLLVDTLGGFGRLLALAVALPALLATPLLVWIAIERMRVRDVRRALNRAASRDPVTGFLHASALSGLVGERRAPSRAGPGGAFLVVDASQIGKVNRNYGFAWRDEALAHIAQAIRSAVRAGDLVARTGEDSFGIFLGGAQAEDALGVGERIRAALAASYFAPEGVENMLDVSVGGVVFEEAPDIQQLYVQAMRALDLPAERSAITIRHLPADRATGPGAGR